MPCISNAVDMLMQTECQHALETALAEFDSYMSAHLKGKWPVEDETLTEVQEAAHKVAKDHFNKNALYDECQEYPKKLVVRTCDDCIWSKKLCQNSFTNGIQQ